MEQGQNLFLILDDGVETSLVFQDGGLILFDCFLIVLYLPLIGDDFLLVSQYLLLI